MDRKRIKERFAALWRCRYAAAVLALGVVLLCLPRAPRQENTAAQERETFDLASVQREMEQILSGVDGAGKLRLMLTVSSGEELELARDDTLSYRGKSDAPENYERRSETVVLGGGTNAQTVVTRTVYPRYQGALIVCEGGGNASVRLALTEAVSALTGLGSDRITVVKGTP